MEVAVPTMSTESAKALRAPFPDSAIGKLPKPLRKDAEKGNCAQCGGWHGLPAVHLDYVGHAAATDRLLSVDPGWTWEPFALTAEGLPALDRDGNLWIRLTVCGVTRPGVGDGASMKERIGDAIRNAAMRFGVALDLWAKEDLHADRPAQQASEDEVAAQRVFDSLKHTTDEQRDSLRALAAEAGRKLTVNELVDPGWRGQVESHLAGLPASPAEQQTLGDALGEGLSTEQEQQS